MLYSYIYYKYMLYIVKYYKYIYKWNLNIYYIYIYNPISMRIGSLSFLLRITLSSHLIVDAY